MGSEMCIRDSKSTNPENSARILFEKLERPEAALLFLTDSWQANKNALKCLNYQFSILQELQRDDEALIVLKKVETSSYIFDAVDKAQLALNLKKKWPHAQLSHEIDELVLRLSASSLTQSPESKQSKDLLALLPQSNPHDPLLERDTNRYRNQKFRPKTIHVGTKSGVLRPKKTIPIPLANAHWTSLTSIDKNNTCLLYTSPSPRDLSTSRMPSSA